VLWRMRATLVRAVAHMRGFVTARVESFSACCCQYAPTSGRGVLPTNRGA
jgi:hypothetical protein